MNEWNNELLSLFTKSVVSKFLTVFISDIRAINLFLVDCLPNCCCLLSQIDKLKTKTQTKTELTTV